VIIWPIIDRSFPISITARPVTQTAEAEEKGASTKERWFFAAEMGSHRRKAPKKITHAKLRTKILGAVKWRIKNVRIKVTVRCGILFYGDLYSNLTYVVNIKPSIFFEVFMV